MAGEGLPFMATPIAILARAYRYLRGIPIRAASSPRASGGERRHRSRVVYDALESLTTRDRYTAVMDMREPSSAVTMALEGPVLLALHGDRHPMSAREVHRRSSRGSTKAVLVALNRLVEQGLVDVQETRHAHLFTLNREHVAAPIVILLASLREHLIERIRMEIETWTLPPDSAILFGSAARGDGDTSSDVDLLLVVEEESLHDDPVWQGQLDTLREHIQRWSGNDASLMVVTGDRLRGLAEERASIYTSIAEDGRVLYGRALRELARGRTR